MTRVLHMEGLNPVDPALLVEYEQGMKEAIPQIIADVARRQALAEEGRRRIFYPKEDLEMSWSTNFVKPVRKELAAQAIDEQLGTRSQTEPAAIDQCNAAKDIAKLLLKSIPGPFVQVSLGGHANGVGWQKKDGYSNDYITVNVYQVADAPAN
jgi:hypothetical protein